MASKREIATLLEDAAFHLEMSQEGRTKLQRAACRDIARDILKLVWRVDSELDR